MSQFQVVVNQITVFAILMFIGFVCAKLQILSRDVLDGLSKLIVKLLLPSLIFHLIMSDGVTIEKIMASKDFAIALFICFVFLGILGFAMAKACHLKPKSANVFIILTMFCNIGFMGIPLIEAMFPGVAQAKIYLSIYAVIDQILLWTIGAYLCSRHQASRDMLGAMKNMINPMTMAIVVALLLLSFQIEVPAVLLQTIGGLGDASRYLALLYLGANLANMSFKFLWNNPSAYMLIGVKMVLCPLLVFWVAGWFLDPTTQMILATIISLPSMVAIVMMAKSYGADEKIATEGVFMGTIACLVTIPLVNYLLNIFV